MLAIGEVRRYANECENSKNKRLMETLGSLYLFEVSEEKALDLTLKKNKGIIGTVMEDEYQ